MCPSLCLAKLSSAPRSLHRRPFLWEAFLDPDQPGPSPPAGLRLGWREQAVATGLLEVCQQYGAGGESSSIFREGLLAAVLGPSTELGSQAHRAPGTRLSDDGMTPFNQVSQATSSWVSSRPLPREVALGRDCGGL